MTRLKEARLATGMSQKAVADALHIAPPSVSNWESGKTNPSQENLKALSKLYHVSIDYLLGRDEEITGLFGEIDRLRGNISGEFSGEEELIESDLSGEAFTEVTCPGCGETLSFPAADLTGPVECPFCGNRFTAGN